MKTKRILSLLLSLTILLSMVPVSFVNAEPPVGYTYDFSSNAFAGDRNKKTQNVYDLANMAASETSYLDSNVSAAWIPAGWRSSNNVSSQSSGMVWNVSSSHAAKPSYSLLAVKVNVPDGGKYIPSLTYSARSCAPVFEIYLVKAGIAVSGYSVDDFKFYAPGDKSDAASRSDAAMYVVAGNGGLGNTGKLGELDMWADYSKDYTNKVTKVFDETTLEGGNYYLIFRPVGKNEKFENLAGTSYFSACIESFKLLPVIPDEITGISISLSAKTLYQGATASATARAVWSVSGNKVLTEGVTYTSSDKNVATVSQDGVVTAVGKGTATITAALDGTKFSDGIDVTVKEFERAKNEYVYSFKNEVFGTSSNVPRWELVKKTFDTVDSKLSAPWQVAGTSGIYNAYANTNGLLWNAYENRAEEGIAALAVELEVKESGTYNFTLGYLADTNAPIADIYLVENDGTLPAFDFEIGNDNLISYIKSLYGENKLGRIDMYSEKAETKNETFGKRYLERGKYYLMINPVGKNEKFSPLVSGSTRYFMMTLSSLLLKPPVGDYSEVRIGVHGLLDENDPMPNMTEKQLEYRLYDDVGIQFDEIDEAELSATYSSSDEAVATISESGLVTAHSNGQTTLTADITYKGVSKTAEYKLTVASCGRNMMENLNSDFEGDEWMWDSVRNDTEPEESVFIRTGIETVPKDGDEDNRAFTFTLNPEVPLGSAVATVTLRRDTRKRVVVEPGKLYQLTFKAKVDVQKPKDAEYLPMRCSVYSYKDATGTSGSSFAYVAGKDTDINKFDNWEEIFKEWQEVVVPVYAPSSCDVETLYLSPRLCVISVDSCIGKTGYSGKIWMDDFEFREVGYAGLEMEISGDPTVAGGGEFTVLSKPYTTLGHYISVDEDCLASAFEISSSDEHIVSNFGDSKLYSIPHKGNVASTVALTGGKNGKAVISGEMTINGITRNGEVEVETSGYDMKLLYAEAKTEPKTVEVGTGAQIEVTGYMSDGSVADMTGGNIIYDSLTSEIVSVDESGKITTLRAGKGKVSATLILGGNSAYTETEIEVTDSSPIESAQLSGPGKVGYLRDEPLILTGKMKSGYDADFTNAKINWIINSNPANGVEVIEGNLVFGNLLDAKATISAKVTLGGETVETNSVEVEVVKSDMRDFIVNFGGVNEKKIKDVKLEDYGWALDAANSHSSVNNSLLYGEYAYILTTGVNQDFAVDFSVPYTGNYTPVFSRGAESGYGAEYVHVYIDGKYAGDVSFCTYDLRGTEDVFDLRSVYLEKGPHKLTLRTYANNKASKNYYMCPGYIRFSAISNLPEISEIVTSKENFTIEEGKGEVLSVKLKMADGFIYDGQNDIDGSPDADISVSYASQDSLVASVSADGTITANAVGETSVTVSASSNGNEKTKEIPIKVIEQGAIAEDKLLDKVEIEAPFLVMNTEIDGVQLKAVGKAVDGTSVDLSNAQITWVSDNPSVAEVSDSGYVMPKSLGSAKISVTVGLNGIEKIGETYVSVREGKVGRTYFSDEMVAAARENVKKYSWAKSETKAVVEEADRYVGLEDTLWKMVPGEGIPRGITVGYRNDPDRYTCRYCGINLMQTHGSYAWISNPMTRPWKIQCPDCKRLFPSNDFESFYELGRDEHGIFNRELALERHQEKFGGTYGTGYLKNELYPEIGTGKCPVKLTGNETPEKWGVDDGFGYNTGRVCTNGTDEIHTYIAYYMHYGLWYGSGNNAGLIPNALDALAKAYMYTGDEKYGKTGAILLDRIADVYPGYDLRTYLLSYSNSDGGARRGKIIGSQWEDGIANKLTEAYDALFPMYDDPFVVSFLNERAKTYSNTEKNDKATPEKARRNIEDGVLREIYREIQRCSIDGNFGSHQATLARAAIVLDNHPETDEMFEWMYKYSETDNTSYNTGGEINKVLINDVSRDGQGNESAPGYNRIWVTQMTEVAEVLAKYDESEGANLYENPKFIAMIKSYAPLTVVRRGLAPIGDSGAVGMLSLLPDNDSVLINAFKETRDIEIAQHLYFIKKGNLNALHYDIFTENPESLSNDVEAIIKEYGEYNYDKSSLLSGYGFGILRDGTLHKDSTSAGIKDTQRDFWMYFGGAQSHSHADKLNLGIEAYGIPLTSDLGYPETAGSDPNRGQWQGATLSHNAVLINEKSQDTGKYSGTPLHFDQKDTRVKVLDVDASVVYATADEYRRTIVMVDYDDEISYGIDFFKVLGGNDHLYSFHAMSQQDPEVSENLKFKAQTTGTYANAAVMYGADPWVASGNSGSVLKYPAGYTWMDDVKRANNPGTGEFYVDWKIKDSWRQSRNGKQDIHLRMTMVNDWAADEVSLVNGRPPRTANNLSAGIDHLEYMLVRRKGRDLNTLFTTVVEPYDSNRYIKSIKNVPINIVSGTPGEHDVAKAVKVELVDGRVDYIVYAQNNNVTYKITDSEENYSFDFKGFVGVWTLNNGVNIYSYLNDGEMIGDDTFKQEKRDAAIKGTITDFQDELSFDNWIEAEFDCELTQKEADELSGRIINVERESLGNSTYVIESVTMLDDTNARINLGNVTLISGFVDAKKEELGYKYDVAIGKKFDIPLSYEDNSAPVFADVSENISTSAESLVTVTVKATGDEGATVTYKARTLPRGASLNSETGIFTWKPDSSQVGENLVAIDAVDEFGRISTHYFTVTVYGSTTGNKNEPDKEPDAPPSGGGGGGAAPADKPETDDDQTNVGEDVTDLPQDEDKTDGENTAPDASGETDDIRFIDIANHTWATDAINELAEDGIIKGTTASTYSPANNITRADFASLLVRAFKLESNNTENFADVSAGDYFATELAIARNNGIISGIGDNKFAPRNTITRQDMMVIVYRAMQKLNVGFGGFDEPQYEDFDTVADYAKEAVSALIGEGLVNGKSGRIAPTDYTTRAEVAVLIKRIRDFKNK